MLSDAEILEDLGQLKDIVESHKAPDAPLSVGSAIIDGHELPVFTKVPANLCELYRIGLTDADQDFLVYEADAIQLWRSLLGREQTGATAAGTIRHSDRGPRRCLWPEFARVVPRLYGDHYARSDCCTHEFLVDRARA